MPFAAAVYAVAVGVLSLASFLAYGLDKRRAANGGRRIPERTLHLLALLGGWPGALLGRRQFRHKTQKVAFRIVFWLTIILHLAVVGTVAFFQFAPHPTQGGLPRWGRPCEEIMTKHFDFAHAEGYIHFLPQTMPPTPFPLPSTDSGNADTVA